MFEDIIKSGKILERNIYKNSFRYQGFEIRYDKQFWCVWKSGACHGKIILEDGDRYRVELNSVDVIPGWVAPVYGSWIAAVEYIGAYYRLKKDR